MQARTTEPEASLRSRCFNWFCWLAAVASAWPAGATSVTNTEAKAASAPPAAWVTPHFYQPVSGAETLEAGQDMRWLLLERQINVAEAETFVHVIRQVLTISGVQHGATLSLDFDPGYQSLTLHWVRIWRGGEHLERLDLEKIKMIRREGELDQFLLNGEHSAVLVLEDVRVGDIIDYAYSIKGENPVYGGRFSASVPLALERPVQRLLTRIVCPVQKRLYAKNHGPSVPPAVVQKKEFIEYNWDLKNVPGWHVEDSLPPGYEPLPSVQLSEYRTWAEVNQWALALFQNTAALSPELLKQIADWRRITDREERILTVLRFLQDHVRYFGIEMGANSHKPAEPATVFARRFGDCKDKALLFVTVLRALGFEAYPVLVNTDLRHMLQDWQPSAVAFDHVIAQVRLDGHTYWLDPTARDQRGSLAAHYLPNYELGLVISPKSVGLTAIPPATGSPRTTITEYVQLRGKTERADFKVVTVAEGRDADGLRAYLAAIPRSEVEKSYTRFYADRYPGIKMASPIAITDQEQPNRIETTEIYTIDNIWTKAGAGSKWRCEFYPYTLAALLKKPVDTVRKMPLGVMFPQHQIVRIQVSLPEAWPAETQTRTISDPAFYFQRSCRCNGKKLEMSYEYRSLAESVPPERAAQYFQNLDQASQLVGYALSWQ